MTKMNVSLSISWNTQEISVTFIMQPFWSTWCQFIQFLMYCQQQVIVSCVCLCVHASKTIRMHFEKLQKCKPAEVQLELENDCA